MNNKPNPFLHVKHSLILITLIHICVYILYKILEDKPSVCTCVCVFQVPEGGKPNYS